MNADYIIIINEYESAADYLAKRGLKGDPGDPLPHGISSATAQYINEHLEDFQRRVRECAYACVMNKRSTT